MPGKKQLQAGDKFGHLTVIGPYETSEDGFAQWVCRCKCGKFITARSGDLCAKRKKHCGCLTLSVRGSNMRKVMHVPVDSVDFDREYT